MSKAILIGNGPSALEKPLGSLIDSDEFDVVIRFNRWNFDSDGTPHNKDTSKYVGTKCNYWILNDIHLTETKIALTKGSLYDAVLIVTPNFKVPQLTPTFNYVKSNHPNIKFIPSEYEDNINQIVDFKPKWPSTGVVGIHFAINHFDEVYLHGFDAYSTKYDNLHYFGNKDAPMGLNKFKYKNTVDHTPQKDEAYLEYVVKHHNVKFLQ